MELRAKEIGKFFKGFSPVAELIFLFSRHLGKGPFMTLGDKYRVIAKPGFTNWFMSYATLCVPEEGLDRAIRESQSHAADEPGAPFFISNILELGQEFLVIFDVVSPACPA